MTTDFRALCAELLWALENAISIIYHEDGTKHISTANPIVERARAALADGPAVPEGREPAAVVSEPTYDDLSELCSQHGLDVDSWPLEKFDALWETARAVLARWGTPNFAETRSLLRDAPQPEPPAEGEVAELVAWLREIAQLWEPDAPRAKQLFRAADLLERLAPQPPAEGEEVELVRLLGSMAAEAELADQVHDASVLDRAADLLRRLSPPQPPADGEVAELVQHLHHAAEVDGWDGASPEWCQSMLRAADLLQRLSPPQPVPVSERLPGPEDCDADGRCWWGRNESDDWSADWTLATHEAVAEFCEFCPRTVWLPAHDLPLPGQEVR